MAARKTVTNATPPSYVTIYESELQIIAGESAHRDGIETGGDLYGAQTRAGRPLIYLATGPGPKAVHAATRFTQDIDFFRQANQVMEDSCGLQWVGTWHSHHKLGLAEPSPGDMRKVRDLTRRNDLRQWVEIIATYEPVRSGLFASMWYRWSTLGLQDPTWIRAGAFVYINPQWGEKVAAPIRVLPGISPFRLALLATGRLDRRALAEHAACFPTEQIVYDALNGSVSTSARVSEIPEALISQIRELPDQVQRKVELRVNEGALVVTFELPDGRAADVGLDIASPYAVRAVRMRDLAAGTWYDLTNEISQDHQLDRLSAIYKALAGTRSCGLLEGDAPDHQALTIKSDRTAAQGETKCDLLL